MKITTLVITHKYGSNVYLCANQQIADAYLYLYVKECWSEWCESPLPSDPDRAIEDYFESAEGHEDYECSTEMLLDTLPPEEVFA